MREVAFVGAGAICTGVVIGGLMILWVWKREWFL